MVCRASAFSRIGFGMELYGGWHILCHLGDWLWVVQGVAPRFYARMMGRSGRARCSFLVFVLVLMTAALSFLIQIGWEIETVLLSDCSFLSDFAF